MNFHAIVLTCVCGHSTKTARVGINHRLEIVATWKCRKCKHKAYSEIPLADILENAPASASYDDKEKERERKICIILRSVLALISDIDTQEDS